MYFPGTILGESENIETESPDNSGAQPAVTIAIAKKKGSNAVWVADAVLKQAEELQRTIVPSDIAMHQPETHAFLAGLHPLGRMGEVQEVVEAVLYLESAAFVTGETLHVDGGAHAGRW